MTRSRLYFLWKTSLLLALVWLALRLTSLPAYAEEGGVVNPPLLVKDINAGTDSSDPLFLPAGDRLFISTKGEDDDEFYDLWLSDGTPSGTQFLKQDLSIKSPVKLNNTWFFIGIDQEHGTELWRTDGTPSGTRLVKDINPGNISGIDLPQLITLNNTLFFAASDAIHGLELWRSDGTSEGTSLLKEIIPGSASSLAHATDLFKIGNRLVFKVQNGANQLSLWGSDGSAQNTIKLKQYTDLRNYSQNDQLTPTTNHLFFFVEFDLWVTDGTPSGTIFLKHFEPVFYSGSTGLESDAYYPTSLTSVDDRLFLQAADDRLSGTFDLWRSDGTTASTVRVQRLYDDDPYHVLPLPVGVYNHSLFFRLGLNLWITQGDNIGAIPLVSRVPSTPMIDVNGVSFFAAVNSTSSSVELWRTDGTVSGTFTITVVSNDVSYIPQLVNLNNALLFSADLDGHGVELWRTNGTISGTMRVADIQPGTQGSNLANFTPFNGHIFFAADDGVHGRDPWVTDGTSANTLLFSDMNNPSLSSNPRGLTSYNDTLFFMARGNDDRVSLWQSDGSVTSTVPITPIVLNQVSPHYEIAKANQRIFILAKARLWGSENGLQEWLPIHGEPTEFYSLPSVYALAVLTNTLFFLQDPARTNEVVGLWKSGDSITITIPVKLTPLSPLHPLINVSGRLYFFALHFDGEYLIHLWTSDGTPEGTQRVQTFLERGQNYLGFKSPPAMAGLSGTLLFLYYNQDNNLALWKSNGTETGTGLLKTIQSNIFFSEPSPRLQLYPLNQRAVFVVRSKANVDQLWSTDGTADGTILLKEINPTLTGPNLEMLTPLNGRKLFFTADDGVHGRELWMTDGTVNGTILVKDIAAGPASANPTGLHQVGDVLLFAATDADGQQALWRTNDSGIRIQRVMDLNEVRNPAEFTVAGSNLFFSADSPSTGRELWKIPLLTDVTLSVTLPSDVIGSAVSTTSIPIQLFNQGLSKATGITLSVTLDEHLTYVADTTRATPSVEGRTLTWKLPDIGLWYQETIELAVRLPAGEPSTTYPVSVSVGATGAASVSGQTSLHAASNTLYLPIVSDI